MSIAKNVHFKGISEVIQAYEHMDIPAFAIFSHAQLVYKCIPKDIDDGADQLRQWLTMMDDTNWSHLTLRVYEDTDKGIKAKTDYDGSFNFQLSENPNAIGGVGGNALVSEVNALKKRLDAYEQGDEDDDGYGMGKIGRMLEHPAIFPLVAPLTDRLMDLILGESGGGKTSRLAGIPAGKVQQDDQAIEKAVTRLKKSVPDLAGLLAKLADMAENSPQKFAMYANTFRNMR